MRLVCLLFSLSLVGCEIVTIKAEYKRKAKKIDLVQDSPEGAVYLFKAELDSNNTYSAADFFLRNGDKYLAIERLDLVDEADRFKRIFAEKQITTNKIDTLANSNVSIATQLNYAKNIKFLTTKKDTLWYISEITMN